MQIFHLKYPIKDTEKLGPVVLALGFFDGVHKGHQEIINTARRQADKLHLSLMVMTFEQHPKEVCAQDKYFPYIDENSEKAAKMEKLGVDYLLFLNFDEKLRQLRPIQFVEEVLELLKPKVIVTGFDYTFGYKALGTTFQLRELGLGKYDVITVAKKTYEDRKISSTRIRLLVQNGQMEEASELLGENYSISGTVVHGLRNGHKLGYPTLNLSWNQKKLLPKIGVYATLIKYNGKTYQAMTSIGSNPTVTDKKTLFIESYLFDFDEDIYGEEITVEFLHFMRGQIKFSSLDGLKERLKLDEVEIKNYFSEVESKQNI
ncbi:MAG: bifunctional riboflavin kinase/FAD synthetase [Lactobacillus sp.]|nr:bifunctional riboflavin kinase/FAD synthetase [Lactobacillus sp.]